MIKLRGYQEQIISEARALMSAGHKNILIQSATGSGKTALTASMLHTSASRGFRSMFVVHRRELIKQSVDLFANYGIPCGVIASGFVENPSQLIQVASVQTLYHRIDRFQKPNILVLDECHHSAANTWRSVYNYYADSYKIGLTATPVRTDGQGLFDFFQQMVQGPTVSSLITDKYLSDYKAYAPAKPDTSKIKLQMGDFKKSELQAEMSKPTITGSAISEYLKHSPNKRNVVFCVSVEHSQFVANQFNSKGIPAAHIDGTTPTKIRDDLISQFRAGIIKVLCNVDLFGEGFDLPAIETVTLLRPTMSLGLYLQQVGRALRPFDGKTHAIILDHAGNIERHGLPDETRQWTLHGIDRKPKTKRSLSVRVCPKCFAAQPSGKSHCQACSHQFEIQSREVKQQDGDLKEISKDEILNKRKQNRTEQGMAETLEDLITLGKRRKYRNPYAWAKHTFNGRQARKINGR